MRFLIYALVALAISCSSLFALAAIDARHEIVEVELPAIAAPAAFREALPDPARLACSWMRVAPRGPAFRLTCSSVVSEP